MKVKTIATGASVAVAAAGAALAARAGGRTIVGRVERRLNPVTIAPPYVASEQAREIHARATVVDLHADPLLWGRDLLVRATRGHVDVPRLIEGNVALQVFGVATKS